MKVFVDDVERIERYENLLADERLKVYVLARTMATCAIGFLIMTALAIFLSGALINAKDGRKQARADVRWEQLNKKDISSDLTWCLDEYSKKQKKVDILEDKLDQAAAIISLMNRVNNHD